jgi:hypothetical protein
MTIFSIQSPQSLSPNRRFSIPAFWALSQKIFSKNSGS